MITNIGRYIKSMRRLIKPRNLGFAAADTAKSTQPISRMNQTLRIGAGVGIGGAAGDYLYNLKKQQAEAKARAQQFSPLRYYRPGMNQFYNVNRVSSGK